MSRTGCKRSGLSMNTSRESQEKGSYRSQRQNVADLMEKLRMYDTILYRHIIGIVHGILKQRSDENGNSNCG